ncbi:MAG: hypothetical protein ACTSRA_06970 [Promethearchaeota archaeon]
MNEQEIFIRAIGSDKYQRLFKVYGKVIVPFGIKRADLSDLIFSESLNDFELVFEENDRLCMLTIFNFHLLADPDCINTELKIRLVSNHDNDLVVKIIHSYDSGISTFSKQIRVINRGRKPLHLLEFSVESLGFKITWDGGGIGQPIFFRGCFVL